MTKLLAQIHSVASSLPTYLLENIINILLDLDSAFSLSLQNRILSQISVLKFRRLVAELLNLWARESPAWNSSSLALALMSSAYSVKQNRQEVDVELVWTGPEVTKIPLRRTDRVLLQLIQEAKTELTLISFAVYKIPEIARMLIKALNRGVKVRLIAENPEVSNKLP